MAEERRSRESRAEVRLDIVEGGRGSNAGAFRKNAVVRRATLGSKAYADGKVAERRTFFTLRCAKLHDGQ